MVSHGEAVAIGMMLMCRQAEYSKLSPSGITEKMEKMLQRFHLPTDYPELEAKKEAIYQAITHDKKARGKQLKIILLEQIGEAKIVSIPIENIRDYIRS